MKVAFYSAQPYDKSSFDEMNTEKAYHFLFFDIDLNDQTVRLAESCDAVCIFVNDHATASVLEKLAALNIKIVVLRCAGFNQVDLVAAERLGIRVYRVPAYSPEAVAEHAVAMILTLNRKTHKAYNRVREGNFSLNRLMGFNLYGKNVGVIGLGKIGLAFAKIMYGFGCELLGYDPVPSSLPAYVTKVDFEQLLSESDIISLHCPLLPSTKHMINGESLALMKQGAMLINTSRGALVQTTDIISALKTGKVGQLGIDVYEQEEKLFFKDLSEHIIDDDDILRLMGFPNVLITSHQGFFTTEALAEIASITLQNLQDAKNGIKTENALS
ncbi:2-hydroxyacid dehydrogenase [Olivibacter sp. XZL3]|uniref:2-hydroxyacid dehydrogenase n=1 Tax=Olivibacter sp. XZL3 TaxID=1735116 RepID=UPI0010665725|nr:2-hydroxyacid dehydrogenase [Olivibacter sp. XZL3]